MGEVQQTNREVNDLSPYPGPRPFNREEDDLFFGRESETGELFSLITAHPALLLYAQSGAGKSSLLNAGLIPLMLREGFEVIQSNGFGGLIPKEVGLEKAANAYVFSTLLRWAGEHADSRQLAEKTFADFFRHGERRTDKRGVSAPRVVIFDQFEEIFTVYLNRWQDRRPFFEQLSAALQEDPFLRVVFAIREDYIAQLDPYADPLPERLRTRFRLERMREDAALLAITEPLKNTGRSFAEGVAESLLEDLLKIRVENDFGEGAEVTEVRGEFVEPVQLQVVCRSMWNKLPAHVSQVNYDHLQSVGNVDAALSHFYDDAIKAVVETVYPFESVLRNWCEERLITSMGTRNMVYREQEITNGLPNTALDALESKHLIRAERRGGGRWYELTHDRFIAPIQVSNTAYRKLIEKASAEVYLALREGDEELQKKRYDSAVESYRKALATSRANGLHFFEVVTLNQIGIIFEINQKYQEALAYYEEALNISLATGEWLRDVESLLRTADLYFKLEKYEDAVRLATTVIEYLPDYPGAYDRRAAAYWYMGEYTEAVADYSRELELLPETAAAWALNGRGQALAEMGAYERARDDLLLAIKLMEQKGDPTAYPRNGLGLAYAGLGQYEEALRAFGDSIAECPDNAWVYYNRAQAYMLMGDTDKAAADLKTSIEKKNPPLNPYKREKAESYLRQHAGPK